MWVLAGVGLMAQTPAASTPTKPRLTLATDAFEDGGIIPNKFTMAAEGTPVSPKLTLDLRPGRNCELCTYPARSGHFVGEEDR
jgi:hypothetical protein